MDDETAGLATDWDSIFRQTLRSVLVNGDDMCALSNLSIGGGKSARELLNYSVQLTEPRDRLLFQPLCRVNLVKAIGRFAWMMSANDRVADVAWYDAAAEKFSDDGWTVPGSADGARLLNPRPGLNQIDRVIRLLRDEPDTRRAVAVIYQPEDAGRQSRDIPCTIGLAFNLRNGGLHVTTIMRSSNAFKILPYDLFLFSLLGEVVAAELGVEFAGYHQFAVSLHIYHANFEVARQVVAGEPPADRAVMPPMPRGAALEHIQALLHLEAELRRPGPGLDAAQVEHHQRRIELELPPYWQDFARVLLVHAVRRHIPDEAARHDLQQQVLSTQGATFHSLLRPETADVAV